jgi:4-alpha-glucanotransferase
MLAQAMRSCAKICVLPVQDILGLDNSARMNAPSTVNINWRWRMKEGVLTEEVQKELLDLTRRYGRFNWKTLAKKAEK